MTQLHPSVRFTALLGAVVFLTGCISQPTPTVAVDAADANQSRPVNHRALSMGAGDLIGQGIFAVDSRTETASVRD